MKSYCRLVALLGAIILSSPVAAQKAGSVEVGAFGRYQIFDRSLDLNNELGFGGRLGIFATRRFELEGDISRISSSFKNGSGGDVRQVPIHARLIYNQPLSDAWALLIGAGYVRNEYRENIDGYDEGAGGLIGARAMLNNWLNFRIDVTSDYIPSPINNATDNWNTGIQAGLGILLFNRKRQEAPVVAQTPPPAPKPIDTDADGVPDSADRCSGTSAGATVDSDGCASNQLDADGDSVGDSADSCPYTSAGSSVDSDGCAPSQKDSDKDGTNDDRDRCAGTPAGTRVDASGCPVVTKTPVVLEGVNFEFGKASLLPEARTVLDQVAASLVANPDVRVEVAGYTDSTGPKAVNAKLSQERAGTVRAYLIENGVSAGQLETKGYGPADPVASNDTREGRSQNRRVELHKIS